MKSLIEQIYAERFKCDSNSRSLAQMIKSVSNDSLSGSRFINELIQNADDAKSKDISFQFVDDYLICSHSGKPFDAEDVQGICDAASPNREKKVDKDAIGEKGIGFKSVFTVSDCILIYSGASSFRFDKNHSSWKQDPDSCPWQIIPIWTEKQELPPNIQAALTDELKTYCVLKLNDAVNKEAEIRRYLLDHVSDGRLMLFLRHIKTIQLQEDNFALRPLPSDNLKLTIWELERKSMQADQEEKSESDDSVSIKWLTHRVLPTIDAAFREQLVAKGKADIAKKYIEAETINLEFAIKLKGGSFVKEDEPLALSCYLPTEVNLNLPFLVNSSFLLDSGRAQLSQKDYAVLWNNFILVRVFYFQFQFLHEIASMEVHWKDVFNLIATPKGSTKEFTQPYELGLSKFDFIKTMEGGLKKLSECLYDQYQFIEKFGGSELKAICLDPHIENRQRLLQLTGGSLFDIKKIMVEIKKPSFKKTINEAIRNKDFLIYLYGLLSVLGEPECKALEKILSEEGIVFGFDKALHVGSELFFPSDEFKYCLEGFNFISSVHPVLAKKAEKDSAFKAFLNKKLKVKPVSLMDAIQRANTSPQELIEFTKKLQNADRKMEDADWQALGGLKLLTVSGSFVEAKDCYLPDSYDPEIRLGSSMENYPYFVNVEAYYDQALSDEEAVEIHKWRRFFLKIRVQQSLSLINLKQLLGHLKNLSPVPFTRMLYEKYFLTEDLERKKFIDHQDTKKLLAENFFLKTKSQQILRADEIYLADFYSPEMKLETAVPELEYLSEEYLEEGNNPVQWGEFFKFLGVRSRIELSAPLVKYRKGNDRELEQYCEYLEKLKFGDTYTNLYPPETGRYKYAQHYINKFWQIKFIDKILGTHLFWQLIAQYWGMLEGELGGVTYHFYGGATPVPSNVEYYAGLSLAKLSIVAAIEDSKDSESKQSDEESNYYPRESIPYYSPRLQEALPGLTDRLSMPVAIQANYLNEEQITFFRFHRHLKLEDCLLLLQKISLMTSPLQDRIKSIAYVYKELARYAGKKIDCAPLGLLSAAGEFRTYHEMIGLICPYFDLPAHPRLLRQLGSLTDENFRAICQSLDVPVIEARQLVVDTKNAQVVESVAESFKRSLPYLALYEAKKGAVGYEEVYALAKRFYQHTNNLIFLHSDVLAVHYREIFQWQVECWYHADENRQVIYLLKDATEAVVTQAMWKMLKMAWNLTAESDYLWAIFIESALERKKKKLLDSGMTLEDIDSLMHRLAHMGDEEPRSAHAAERCLEDQGEKAESRPQVDLRIALPIEKPQGCPELLEHKEERGVPASRNLSPYLLQNTNQSSSMETSDDEQVNPVEAASVRVSPSNAYRPKDPEHGGIVSLKKQPSIESQTSLAPPSFPASSKVVSQLDAEDAHAMPSYQAREPVASFSTFSQTSFSLASQLTKPQRLQLGRHGEQLVYNHLCEKYTVKYGKACSIDAAGKITIQRESNVKSITWCNKDLPEDSDSGEPYDFIIEIRNNEGDILKTRYFEVKSSLRKANLEVSLSEREWGHYIKAVQEPEKYGYKLFLVSGVNDPEPQLEKYNAKKLKQLMDGGQVKAKNYKQLTFFSSSAAPGVATGKRKSTIELAVDSPLTPSPNKEEHSRTFIEDKRTKKSQDRR